MTASSGNPKVCSQLLIFNLSSRLGGTSITDALYRRKWTYCLHYLTKSPLDLKETRSFGPPLTHIAPSLAVLLGVWSLCSVSTETETWPTET